MAIYKYTSLPSMEAMGINPNSNSKITAIKDQTGKVTGYEVNTNNNKEVEEFDVVSNISTDLKNSINDINYSKKTDNVFKFQLDGIKIINLQDKNGINITKYVKGCSVLKIDDSKVYLDNGNIIYYDQNGFKYITGDIYEYNDSNYTKKKLLINVIAYVDKDTNQVIGYDNCKNMYASDVDHEQVVSELLNDENFVNLYKKKYPDDEEFSNISNSSYLYTDGGSYHYDDDDDDNNPYISEVIGIFRFYNGKEEEFEKIFGFPMYVTNKDGLKVYNIYKLVNVRNVDLSSVSDVFSDYLYNSYNIYNIYDCREMRNFSNENKEVFIKNIKEALNQSSSVRIDICIKGYSSIDIHDSYIENITDDGDLILINNDNSKIIIKYEDLVKNNQHYSVYLEINEIKQFNGIGDVSIFDEENIKSKQYGGNQYTFNSSAKELLEDPIIVEKLRQCYPDATMEEYELYLRALAIHGCGYVSCVNTIFKEYETQPEKFEEKFGFPMCGMKHGRLDFNYEYLVLDFFNYVNSNLGYSIQELYGNIGLNATTGKVLGFDNSSYSVFQRYLKERYNIDIEINGKYLRSETNKNFVTEDNSFDYSEIIDAYKQLKNDDNIVVIGAGDFDLYPYDDYIKKGTLTKRSSVKCGGHCMTVTGVTEDGNLIVSSCGEKEVFDIASLERYGGNIDFHAISLSK